MRQLRFGVLFTVLALLFAAVAQDPTSSASSTSSSPSPSLSLSLTTGSTTVRTSTTSNGRVSTFSTVVPTTFNVTVTVTPTSTSTSDSTSSASTSPTPEPIVLDTRLDPAFGVLGVILILTGLPSAFWGHKNRWTSFFLIGFYTFSLVCFVLILRFGILRAINPPSKTLRGMFVLASGIAGIAGGVIAIFFWKVARYGIGAWGGLALALWVQCFHNGGLIKAVGFRWILYIGCAVVGFVLCTIPKIHYHVLLISTAFVGSSALMLGVDCFTTAGLKEFYVWNIGFSSLFNKFTDNGIQFPVSQTMQIELGLIGAVALMGIAVQLRIYKVLKRKLDEIAEEQKKQDEESEIQAAGDFAHVLRDREIWEKEHGGKYDTRESGSSMPLMKDHDGSASPRSESTHVADLRPRHHSGVSDFMAAPTPDDELKRATRGGIQSPGALPTLDLGLGIKDDVPYDFMTSDDKISSSKTEDMKKKEELVAEIETIRRSIDVLKTGSPVPSSTPPGSRRPSLTSRRTLSMDANSALLPPSHLRPPRERDPRARIHSMDLMGNAAIGESIGRPTSAPLRDLDWDAYIQERKLLQPPQGVTPPIATTPITPQTSRIQMPPAVAEALQQRKRRESALGIGVDHSDSSEDIPLGQIERDRPRRTRRNSAGGNIPVTILPPKKPIAAPTPQRPVQTRTKTFEELNERHREKMRDMQRPLTTVETEQAQLTAAKQRWERAKALEKEAVTRRQAEQATLLERRKKSEDDPRADEHGRRHSRSPSADRLGGSSSKRLSTMKVEDWQRYQQEVDGSGRRDSVPFPGPNKQNRRGSKDMLKP